MGLLRTATFNEPDSISDFLKYEAAQEYCRDKITVASGEGVLEVNTLLGKVTLGAASSAAKSGGNTGNGTLVLDVTTPVLAGAAPGVYSVRFTTTTNVRLEDPNGRVIADVAIGGSTGNTATVQEQIKGVLTQGATPFAAGDGFDITIADGSGEYKKCKLTALDGSAVAAGVLCHAVDATSAAQAAVAVVRGPAVGGRLGLKFDATFDSAGKKSKALAQLETRGIVVRDSA
jgi:hypothetical protein